MSDLQRSGSCLCEKVKFEVTLTENAVHICHCSQCRKWSGGSALCLGCLPEKKIEGEEFITWYDSSEFAQRSFCKNCGTHLFFRTKDGSYNGVSANFDDLDGLEIGEHIFIDNKPSYYDFADDKPRLTEKEFLKKIGELEE